jgi:hypothetical protein
MKGGRTMQPQKITCMVILLIAITSRPFLAAATDMEETSARTWRSQMLKAWGNNNLAVDFGSKCLWNYDGSWIQLSRWNPQAMEAWGDHMLAVDFGPNGLWNYDGITWFRISDR